MDFTSKTTAHNVIKSVKKSQETDKGNTVITMKDTNYMERTMIFIQSVYKMSVFTYQKNN